MKQEALLAASAAAETLINKALAHDPASLRQIQSLAGKVVALHISQPDISLWLCFSVDGVNIHNHFEHSANTSLSGRLVDLLALAREQQFNLAGTGVTVQGETSLLQTLKHIGAQLDIDWEDWLAEYLSDELAHPLAQGMRRLHRFGRTQLQQAQAQLAPWLTEELELLPSRHSLDQFGEQVQQLAQATDRLEARLNHWLSQRAKP